MRAAQPDTADVAAPDAGIPPDAEFGAAAPDAPLHAAETWFALPFSDHLLIFALLMGLVLVAPMLATRLRLPGIIGLIVAGIIVGPNAANLLARDDTIVLLGTIGLLYIVFVAGLEIDLHQFARYRMHSVTFGSISFLVPQVIGACMAAWLLGFDWMAAILLGSMFGSHTLLSYPIASRLGLARNPAVTSAVGGTIMTDTCALLVLAVIAGATRGSLDLMFWLKLGGALTIYVSIVLIGLPRLGRQFFRIVQAESVPHFVFAFAALLICAYGARASGVEPIIGAFLAGLALNRLVPEHSVLMSRIKFIGESFFIPIFLISVGMLVDLMILMRDPSAWKIALAMCATVIAAKFIAAGVAHRLLGYSVTEGWVMFGLSVNQAAATLAAVMVGFALGIFDEAVLNGTVMMILVSCMLGPWITERFGRRLAETMDSDRAAAAAPTGRILVPLADPRVAESLLDLAFLMRDKGSSAPVHPLAVSLEGADTGAQVAAAERMLGRAVVHGAAASVPVQAATRVDMSVAAGISRAIKELRISTVVMGWSGAPAARNAIFGSILDQLLEQVPQQFLVARLRRPVATCERLVMIVPPLADRELGFDEAMRTVKRLAQQIGAELLVAGNSATIARLEKRLPTIKPDVPVTYESGVSPSAWAAADGPEIKSSDLVVLLAGRSHRISWRASLDRLPRQIAARARDANLIVLYPTEQMIDATSMRDAARESDEAHGGLFAVSRMLPRSEAIDPGSLVEEVLTNSFGDRPQLMASIRSALLEERGVVPIEVTTGVVLLHAHVTAVARPTAFVATCEPGISVAPVDNPASIIFILLTPADFPPARHLECLARIAKLVYSDERLARLRAAHDPGELMELLDDGTTDATDGVDASAGRG